MDLSQWRSAVKEQAGRWRQRLSNLVRQADQLAPGVIYGATAGLAVLPLVAAAQSGAVPYGELMALLGSAGVNLLTAELYDWRKRSEAELDEDLPARLGELAGQNADWRDLLDKLVQETQAAASVQAEMGQAAGAYLAALRRDVERVGSCLIVANVSGSKNVIIGDNNVMNVTENHYDGPPPPITFDDIVRLYLYSERRTCDELPLARLKADARRIPRLQRVFVDPRTTLPVDETTWFCRLGVPADRRQQVRR